MSAELRLYEAQFRAFGSTCRIVCDRQAPLDAAVHRLEDLEDRWSRFRPSSEISRLNASEGRGVEVSEVTRRLIWLAGEAHRLTDGAFDPLMLNELRACGYDRSHELLEASTGQLVVDPAASPKPNALREVRIAGNEVSLPRGLGFDPGGIGKGLAGDLVLDDMLSAGSQWACISLGGDMVFGGDALRARGQRVVVQDPWTPEAAFGELMLETGAVATSSTRSRRWIHDGVVRHHLFDSRLRAPSLSPRVAATVHAPSGWLADVLAKSVVLNTEWDTARLAELSASAVAFDAAGHIDLGLFVGSTGAELSLARPLAA